MRWCLELPATPRRWALLAVLAAACGEGPTAPGSEPSDVERMNEAVSAVRAELIANLDVAGDVYLVTVALEDLGNPPPPDLFGLTFVREDAEGGYVPSARAGAPADGLRFIVYDGDAPPLVEDGFLDVTDEGSGTGEAVGVHLEKEGVVRLGYRVARDSPDAGDLSATGFVTGGPERVDFDVTQGTALTPEGLRLELDYSLSLAGRGVGVDLEYRLYILPAGEASFAATFRNANDELVLDLTQQRDGTIAGNVERNGQVQIAITHDAAGEPLFLDPSGEELPPGDARAIRGLFDFASEGLGFLLPYLIVPAEDLPATG